MEAPRAERFLNSRAKNPADALYAREKERKRKVHVPRKRREKNGERKKREGG